MEATYLASDQNVFQESSYNWLPNWIQAEILSKVSPACETHIWPNKFLAQEFKITSERSIHWNSSKGMSLNLFNYTCRLVAEFSNCVRMVVYNWVQCSLRGGAVFMEAPLNIARPCRTSMRESLKRCRRKEAWLSVWVFITSVTSSQESLGKEARVCQRKVAIIRSLCHGPHPAHRVIWLTGSHQ